MTILNKIMRSIKTFHLPPRIRLAFATAGTLPPLVPDKYDWESEYRSAFYQSVDKVLAKDNSLTRQQATQKITGLMSQYQDEMFKSGRVTQREECLEYVMKQLGISQAVQNDTPGVRNG